MRNYVVIAALLFAAPLAAQGNTVITVNDTTVVTIFDNDTTVIIINFPQADSADVARAEAAERAMQSIADYLENCGCVDGGGAGATVVKYGVPAVAVLIGFLGIRRLTQIADAINNHDHPEASEEPEDTPSEDYPGGHTH